MNTTQKTLHLLRRMAIVPRWFIFLLDLFFSSFALLMAFFLRNNLVLNTVNWKQIFQSLTLLLMINLLVFVSLRTYRGIVRYTGVQDALRVFFSVSASAFLFYVIPNFTESSISYLTTGKPDVLHIIYATFCFLFLMGYRVLVKQVFVAVKNIRSVRKSVVIFGAGEAGVATKRVLAHNTRTNFNILGFVDEDKKKKNKSLDGVPIMDFDQFKDMISTTEVDELIIASFTLSPQKKNEIVDFCLDHDINVLVVPPYSQWADGTFAPRQLRNIRIEELLERDPIVIENEQIRKQVKRKRILVTGAAGSIGSEIVRQLLQYQPEMIILCDQAETPLHELDLQVKEMGTAVQCITYLTSVNQEARMDNLFSKFRPHHVYHAAAYKHVPMMEFNPVEAIRVNVLGTKQVADLAVQYGVDRFVMVSTDKAVNPTNVMGASKRLAEMYVQSLSAREGQTTRFITTRFGNVLGSNGSVILRFKEQIEKGGPLTVTHPNITRYFMTIPEACQLVLEAGSMGNGGEVFVFDMGEPVRIADLAKKMIRLYGLVPNVDINITYCGLRPGEKLYEELLTDGENTIKTYHEKIMIAKVREVNSVELEDHLALLSSNLHSQVEESKLVGIVKKLVPEYISNNSIFEQLDQGKVVAIR